MLQIETFDALLTMNPLKWRGKQSVRENQKPIMTRKRTSEKDLSLSAGASPAAARRTSASRTRAKHATPPETPSTSAEPEIATPQVAAANSAYQPGLDDIRELAFLYWEARGCQGGSPEEDWLRAERELRMRNIAASA